MKKKIIGILIMTLLIVGLLPTIKADIERINTEGISTFEKVCGKIEEISDTSFGNPNWIWAEQAIGTDSAGSNDICVDGNGNSYITGSFKGAVTFGSTTLTCIGVEDIFMAKIDSNGNWQWAEQASGTDLPKVRGICVDGTRNLYITGSFKGAVTFGSTTLNSIEPNVFVAKMDTNGNWQWAEQASGSGSVGGRDISEDGTGNLYITGSFKGAVTFGSTTLNSIGPDDVFVAKIDTNGNWQWAEQAGGTSFTGWVTGICADGNGNSYITGWFVGSITFDSITLNCVGYNDIFVAKIDTNGNWQWAKRAGAVVIDYCSQGEGICVDGNGNSYIIGGFEGTIFFDSIPLNCDGYFDVFVAKIDANGNWQWALNVGGTDLTTMGIDICADGNGNSYITGNFDGTVNFGSISLTHQGDNDVFVAKIDTNGNWQWALKAGGIKPDSGSAIDVDGNGNAYATGIFSNTATFGYTTLTSTGDTDIFVGRIGDQPKSNDIIYHEDHGDSIWRMQSSGSGQTKIIDDGWFAKYSPNFMKIAYSDYYNNGIYVMDANGGNPIKLTSNGTAPFWSPTGNQIVYHVGGVDPLTHRIWIVDSNGGNPHKIADYQGSFPEWSPDGEWIAYHGHGTGIWIIQPNGQANKNIHTDGGYPSWKPDLSGPLEICYSEFTDDHCIWRMKVDTTQGNSYDHVKVSEFPGIHPDWCPNDVQIAYEAGDPVQYKWIGISIVNLIGAPNDQLINDRGHAPDWGNAKPNKPSIVGPPSGKTGKPYDYGFTSIDPDSDIITQYTIDWGDGTIDTLEGPFTSGEEVTASHTWSAPGDFTISAKAKDIHAAESDWGTLDVSMPRTRLSPKTFLLRLFERFPNLFPILQGLLLQR